MNLDIVPKDYSMDMKDKYNGSDEWKAFARKIQKNPFVKNYLLTYYQKKCCWCSWSIDGDYVLHHLTYDHKCTLMEFKEYKTPTEKRPNRKVVVPDCEKCSIENTEAFQECMSKLVPVHKRCNFKIENHH